MMAGTRRLALVAALGTTVSLLAVSPATAARDVAVAPPPPAQELVAATNAMLQPLDLAAPVAATRGDYDSTGFLNPPGGDDPMPVCSYSSRRRLAVPAAGAVGYSARSGPVVQNVYTYADGEAASRVWSRLSAKIADRCRGTWRDRQGDVTTLTRKQAAPVGQDGNGWAIASTGNGLSSYSVANLIGDSIQLITYQRQADTLRKGAPAAVEALALALGNRWRDRATLPLTQPALVTQAENAMLAPTDVPPALPVTSPQDGGGSSFQAFAPGLGPMTCWASARPPRGTHAFSSFLGATDSNNAGTGVLSQDVESYATEEAAENAWTALRTVVLRCGKQPPTPPAARPPLSRPSSGVSSQQFNGVPGVWSASFDTWNVDEPFASNQYTLHLLVGATIQSVSYVTSHPGLKRVPLDQAAVNALAEQLALRWQRLTEGE